MPLADNTTDLSLSDRDSEWMRLAIAEATRAEAAGEVPVGAVLVREAAVIGRGGNQQISAQDPTAHAEVVALRAAARAAGNYRLPGSTLYVTLEPCTMCVGAIVHARVARVVFGTFEPRAGALRLLRDPDFVNRFNHRPEVTGPCLQDECAEQLRAFFRARRDAAANPDAFAIDSEDSDHD
ncbi:MAG: tRNA adenosine(34) deaminase TadA [Pseudomonadota bacterium]